MVDGWEEYRRELEKENLQLRARVAERNAPNCRELQGGHPTMDREHRTLLENLVSTGPALCWAAGTDKMCCFFNQAWVDFTGRTLEQEMGTGWSEGVHPEDFQRCLAVYVESFDRREPFEMEYRLRRFDGEYRWIRDIGKPVFDSQEDFCGYIGHCFDISAIKQANQALLESEWKFRALFNMGPIGVAYHRMVYDQSGAPIDYYFIDANDNYQKLTGVDPRGKLVTEAFPGIENDPFDWIGVFGEVARTGRPIRFESFLQPNSRWYDCVGYQYQADHFVAAFLEITDRKRAEEQLRQVQKLRDKVFAHGNDVIVVIDRHFITRFQSSNSETHFGWKPEEVVNQSVWNLVHPDDQPQVKAHFCLLLEQSGNRAMTACRYRCRDGRYRWIEIALVNLLDDQDIRGLLGNYHDITERRQAEKALRESEERFQLLFDQAPLGYQSLDAKGCFIEVNQRWLETLGYKRADVIGRWFGDFLPPSLREPFQRCFAEFKRTGTVHCEFEMLHGNGGRVTIEFEGRIGTDLHGRFKQTHCILQDITEIKKARERLRESEKQMRLILEATSELVIYYGADRHVVWANRAAQESLSAAAPHLKNLTCTNLWEYDPHDCPACPLNLASQQGTKAEAEMHTKDGRIWQVRVHPIVDEAGQLEGLVEFRQEITSRKLAEKELIQAKEAAEAASKAKDDFLAVMSHELRTPLNPIIGFASLMSEAITEKPWPEYLQIMIRSGERMLKLVDDLLDFSRLQHSAVKLSLQPFPLLALLQESHQAACSFAQDNQMAFRNGNGPEWFPIPEDLIIQSDPGILHQILSNLLVNACKFTRRGMIVLTAGMRWQSQQAVILRLTVEDDGIGIAPGQQRHIFEPFVQVDSSLTRPQEGAGLGLAICRKLVDLLGGRIGVVSAVGHGSLFWFEIPVQCEVPLSSPLVPGECRVSRLTGSCRILLAEDHENNQQYMKACLDQLGAELRVVANGQEVLQELDKARYDLILMDIRMPVMDGFEATRRIRAGNQQNSIPILALTAHAEDHLRDQAIRLGMDGYIPKPIRFQDLAGILENTLSGTRSS